MGLSGTLARSTPWAIEIRMGQKIIHKEYHDTADVALAVYFAARLRAGQSARLLNYRCEEWVPVYQRARFSRRKPARVVRARQLKLKVGAR